MVDTVVAAADMVVVAVAAVVAAADMVVVAAVAAVAVAADLAGNSSGSLIAIAKQLAVGPISVRLGVAIVLHLTDREGPTAQAGA